jgi:hypothetical protein
VVFLFKCAQMRDILNGYLPSNSPLKLHKTP